MSPSTRESTTGARRLRGLTAVLGERDKSMAQTHTGTCLSAAPSRQGSDPRVHAFEDLGNRVDEFLTSDADARPRRG
jgi:hypothetical protein